MAITTAISAPELSAKPNAYLLNAWPRIMQERVWAFNQVSGRGAPLASVCEVYLQEERDVIAQALFSAVRRVATYLNYWPMPQYFSDTIDLGRGVPFQYQLQETQRSKYLIELGSRATAVLQAAAPVVYSDSTGGAQGFNDTATITVAAPNITDPDEVQVFFQTTDGAYAAADERFQIVPLRVTLSGGNAVITGPRALFVKPSTIWFQPYDPTDPNALERNHAATTLAAGFVTAVDVYRVYTNTTTPVQVVDRKGTVLQSLAAYIEDPIIGTYTLDADCWSSSTCSFPNRLRVNYRAGLGLVDGYMDSQLEEAIIRYANTLMPDKLISYCDRTNDRWEQDRSPLVGTLQDKVTVSTLSPVQARNPLGLLRGAVYAWDVVQSRALPRAGKLTYGRR